MADSLANDGTSKGTIIPGTPHPSPRYPTERCYKNPPHFIIAHPHLLVLATNERFLPAGATFIFGLANENQWLQPVLVLTVHWWPTSVLPPSHLTS